jgi:membrane-associated protein
MDFLPALFDFILHVDKHLAAFVAQYGFWIYGLLFAIIFVETGVVVFPFLPGDSLLFIVGTMCGTGLLEFWIAAPLMFAAAVLGNQSNYTLGRYFGPKVFQWEQSRFFNKRAFDNAHGFYEKWGGITLIIGRFMPFVRTFAPFVAGVAQMTRRKFSLFDVTGGALWIFSVTGIGLAFGNVPVVKRNLELIIWSMILIPGVIALVGGLRARRARAVE